VHCNWRAYRVIHLTADKDYLSAKTHRNFHRSNLTKNAERPNLYFENYPTKYPLSLQELKNKIFQ
jgi:hypothetical protein